MIGVAIQCRLGNQLFQYAFAKALSKKLGTSFFLIEGSEKLTIDKYFNLDGYGYLKNVLRKAYFKIKNRQVLQSLHGIEIQSPGSEFKDDQVYIGYFQSELFFQNIAQQITSNISVKSKYINIFNQKYKCVYTNNKVIAVHIRRGDYLHLNYWWKENLGSDNLSLPLSYYKNCLAQVENLESYKIIIVSDDINYLKESFSEFENVDFAGNEMMTDFQILLNADICILSNSSFSWWAAYLNNKKNKKIFCPKYWLGFHIKKEYPPHTIPEQWQQVETS